MGCGWLSDVVADNERAVCWWRSAWCYTSAVCRSCSTGSGTQGNAGGVEVAADGLGMHAELAADGGAGLAGEVVLLGLALLLVAQATWPAGDAPSGAEVTDLLPADAIALADLAYWRALLVQGDHLILLRWRKAGVMLAQTPRRGNGYGGRSGFVVGGCWACGRGDSSVGGGSGGGDFAFERQRPGEL